jgi:hypothetical protein
VLTSEYVHVMGGKDSVNFQNFQTLCGVAFNILRKDVNHFISLFAMVRRRRPPTQSLLMSLDPWHFFRYFACLLMRVRTRACCRCWRQGCRSFAAKRTSIT